MMKLRFIDFPEGAISHHRDKIPMWLLVVLFHPQLMLRQS